MLEYMIMAGEMHIICLLQALKLIWALVLISGFTPSSLNGFLISLLSIPGWEDHFSFIVTEYGGGHLTPTPAFCPGVRLVLGYYRSLPRVCLCLATSLQLWPLLSSYTDSFLMGTHLIVLLVGCFGLACWLEYVAWWLYIVVSLFSSSCLSAAQGHSLLF